MRPVSPVAVVPFPTRDFIEAAARRHGIDPVRLAAVAKPQSSFNPRAQSGMGAKRLMRLIGPTAGRLRVTVSFDPARSLEGGNASLVGLLSGRLAAAAPV